MKKFSLLCLVGSCVLSLICTNANAQPGHNASVVCTSINDLKTEKIADCYSEISKYWYFSNKATALCAILESDDNKLDCIKAIGNKVYYDNELLTCKKVNSDLEKLNCFIEMGVKIKPQF